MKTTSSKIMKAAALAILAAGAASAQSLKGEIPFTFSAGKSVLPAGTYRVEVKTANQMVILSNSDAKKNVILLSTEQGVAAKEWKAKGDPVLAFECTAGHCALVRLWTGYESPVLSIPHRSSDRKELASLTLIPMVRAAE